MPELSDQSKAFLSDLADLFNEVDTGVNSAMPTAELPLVGALLDVFDPHQLLEETQTSEQLLPTLVAQSHIAPGYSSSRLRSIDDPRRFEMLKRLGTKEAALDELARHPDRIRTPTQILFENLLEGELPDLSRLKHGELRQLQMVNGWVGEIAETAIPNETLERALGVAASIRPFEHLLSESFLGREDEIEELSEFVGIRNPSLVSSIGDMFFSSPVRLLVIEGVGGVGKTALLGHFLHEYHSDADGPLFPFAYLACDDPRNDIRTPQRLLLRAVRQLEGLVNASGGDHGAFKKSVETFNNVASDYGTQLQRLSRRSVITSQTEEADHGYRMDESRKQIMELARAFAHLCEAASEVMRRSGGGHPPVVLFIDTFEEVQFHAREHLLPFWALLDELLHRSKSIRILLSGRGPMPNIPLDVRSDKITLLDLEPPVAVKILGEGIELEESVLYRIVDQIGGNPLNIRLTRRILQEQIEQEGLDRSGLKGLKTKRILGFFRIGAELIRGRLYQRLLNHIHDPDVRTLAHPGMVVRRVTPDTIEHILAPVCKISVDAVRAIDLFEALKAEHTLVRVDVDNSLRYREDVRKPVLKLLTAEQTALVNDAHNTAFEYYRTRAQQDPVDAAEAIYHGLHVVEDHNGLDAYWHPEAAAYLANAIDEFSPTAKVWLAGRMSIEIDSQWYADAQDEAFERAALPRVLSALQYDGPKAALAILDEHSTRSPESPLHVLEARCYLGLDDAHSALEKVDKALAELPVQANRGFTAELLWTRFQALSALDQYARDALTAAIEACDQLTNPIPLIQTLAVQAGPFGGLSDEQVEMLRQAMRRLTEQQAMEEADVVRAGYAALPEDIAPSAADALFYIVSSVGEIFTTQDFTPDSVHFEALTEDVLADTPLAKLTAERFGGGHFTTADLLTVLSSASSVLFNGEKDPGYRYALTVFWRLLQMEDRDLIGAQLAGLKDYQAAWRVQSSKEYLSSV